MTTMITGNTTGCFSLSSFEKLYGITEKFCEEKWSTLAKAVSVQVTLLETSGFISEKSSYRPMADHIGLGATVIKLWSAPMKVPKELHKIYTAYCAFYVDPTMETAKGLFFSANDSYNVFFDIADLIMLKLMLMPKDLLVFYDGINGVTLVINKVRDLWGQWFKWEAAKQGPEQYQVIIDGISALNYLAVGGLVALGSLFSIFLLTDFLFTVVVWGTVCCSTASFYHSRYNNIPV